MTNHDDSCLSQATWKSWEGATSAASSPVIAPKSPHDSEEEDRSVHPRRTNSDLVRKHALIDNRRRSSLDRVSVSSDNDVSVTAGTRSNRGSVCGSVEDIAYSGATTRSRESVSSENGDVSKLNDKNPDGSHRSGDGSNRGWCNFCFETGHIGTGCPWHPKIPVNDPQLAGGWREGSQRGGKSPTDSNPEWPGVDFGDEKDWLQGNGEEFEGETHEEVRYVVKEDVKQSPSARYLDPLSNYSSVHDRSWGARSPASFHPRDVHSRRNSNSSYYESTASGYNSGGWISVDPSKAYDDDSIRIHQDGSRGSFHDSDFKPLGESAFLNEESYHTTRGGDDYSEYSSRPAPGYTNNDQSEGHRLNELLEDGSLDASFRSFDGSDTSVSSTRSGDSRRRRAGGSRSCDGSANGRTGSATVTIIAPSVITFMHPRVPAKAVANSPVKPRSAEHRRSASHGFLGTSPAFIHPSSPGHKPQDYYNDQRSAAAAAARVNYTNDLAAHHRMGDPVLIEAPKKLSVDETVGVVPPVIGKRCHKCWGYGHLHAQCPSRNGGANAKNSRDGSWKQCRYCRERGHVFSDCPHLQPMQSGGYSPNLAPTRITPTSPPRTVSRP